MVQCSFNISEGQQATVGKYYQEASSGAKNEPAVESDSEVKKKGRKRRQRRRKKNKTTQEEEVSEEDIYCEEEGLQQPLSDCEVDHLN
jgi:hypothetical protein